MTPARPDPRTTGWSRDAGWLVRPACTFLIAAVSTCLTMLMIVAARRGSAEELVERLLARERSFRALRSELDRTSGSRSWRSPAKEAVPRGDSTWQLEERLARVAVELERAEAEQRRAIAESFAHAEFLAPGRELVRRVWGSTDPAFSSGAVFASRVVDWKDADLSAFLERHFELSRSDGGAERLKTLAIVRFRETQAAIVAWRCRRAHEASRRIDEVETAGAFATPGERPGSGEISGSVLRDGVVRGIILRRDEHPDLYEFDGVDTVAEDFVRGILQDAATCGVAVR